MISPNRVIRGGSLSFSGVKYININEGVTLPSIQLSYAKHVLQILNEYIVLSE